MWKLPVLALLLACTTANAEGPWRKLFNGKDLAGWEHVGPGSCTVEEGLLKTHGGMGLLWYTGEKFGNAVIRIVFRTPSPRGNSGVFIRIADKPIDPWYAVHHGYEVQIEDAGDDYHRTGVIYSMSKALAKPPAPPGGWNTMEITLDGRHTVVHVNGVKVTDFYGTQPAPERKQWYEPERGPRPDYGYIGLQNHDESSTLEFREVMVRPLARSERSQTSAAAASTGPVAASAGAYNWSGIPAQKLADGLTRQILYGKNIMMMRVVFPPNFAPPPHKHPHEQWEIVEKGPITFSVGDQQQTLETGALLYVPSNVMHGGRSGAGGAALLDVFSPIREDLLK